MVEKIPFLAVIAAENVPLACGVGEDVVVNPVTIKLDCTECEF